MFRRLEVLWLHAELLMIKGFVLGLLKEFAAGFPDSALKWFLCVSDPWMPTSTPLL